jgi:hypothetical protein
LDASLGTLALAGATVASGALGAWGLVRAGKTSRAMKALHGLDMLNEALQQDNAVNRGEIVELRQRREVAMGEIERLRLSNERLRQQILRMRGKEPR